VRRWNSETHEIPGDSVVRGDAKQMAVEAADSIVVVAVAAVVDEEYTAEHTACVVGLLIVPLAIVGIAA